MLEFTQETRGNSVIISLKGQLDAITAGTIKPTIEELISARTPYIILNLIDLSLIDSSGVGAIVSLFKRTRAQGGDTKIAHLNKQPREVFHLLRLDKAISIFDSVDQALESIKSSPPATE